VEALPPHSRGLLSDSCRDWRPLSTISGPGSDPDLLRGDNE